MATVWTVHDRLLDRVVALKRPHPAPADDPTVLRFMREARLAAGINHPNVITIHDAGEDENGPYLVMDLIEGPTLAEVDSLDRRSAIDLVATLAGAVAAIHATGIVHRDIKPGNVILSPDGPRLTDFGIALDPSAITNLTVPGSVMATMAYAAPEVLAGQPAGEAADVYSLGVILHQLITGTPPTEGQIELVGEPHVDALLAQMLGDDPDQRPPAADVARRLLEGQMLATRPLTVPLPVTPQPKPTYSAALSPDDPTEMLGVESSVATGRPRRFVMAALAVAMAIGILLVANGVLSGTDRGTARPESTVSTATVVKTTIPPESTTTSPTTTPSTTTLIDVVEAAETALRDHIASIAPNDLKPKDEREIQERIGKALAAWSDGNLDKATDELKKVAESVDKHVDNRTDQHEAIDLLTELAAAMGLDVEFESDR